MNEITMKMQADQLIRMALQEEYYKRGCFYKCGYADSNKRNRRAYRKRRWCNCRT